MAGAPLDPIQAQEMNEMGLRELDQSAKRSVTEGPTKMGKTNVTLPEVSNAISADYGNVWTAQFLDEQMEQGPLAYLTSADRKQIKNVVPKLQGVPLSALLLCFDSFERHAFGMDIFNRIQPDGSQVPVRTSMEREPLKPYLWHWPMNSKWKNLKIYQVNTRRSVVTWDRLDVHIREHLRRRAALPMNLAGLVYYFVMGGGNEIAQINLEGSPARQRRTIRAKAKMMARNLSDLGYHTGRNVVYLGTPLGPAANKLTTNQWKLFFGTFAVAVEEFNRQDSRLGTVRYKDILTPNDFQTSQAYETLEINGQQEMVERYDYVQRIFVAHFEKVIEQLVNEDVGPYVLDDYMREPGEVPFGILPAGYLHWEPS